MIESRVASLKSTALGICFGCLECAFSLDSRGVLNKGSSVNGLKGLKSPRLRENQVRENKREGIERENGREQADREQADREQSEREQNEDAIGRIMLTGGI